jgi:hypothetical protein
MMDFTELASAPSDPLVPFTDRLNPYDFALVAMLGLRPSTGQ